MVVTDYHMKRTMGNVQIKGTMGFPTRGLCYTGKQSCESRSYDCISTYRSGKKEKYGPIAQEHNIRCACPRPRVPFRCSTQLYYMFLRSREPVRSDPSCICPLKRFTRARSFMTFGCFLQARVCAPFLCRFRACTCEDLSTHTFRA